MHTVSRAVYRAARTVFLICLLCVAAPAPRTETSARAAEFDIDAGRAVLRRLQYCEDCGSALLVTDVSAGRLIRCPDCGREQTRLDNKLLLTQLYQICKLCSGPLDPEGHSPGDLVECPVCGTKQPLVDEAFVAAEYASGPGYRPGFPPGTGKKTLLLSPNRSDAQITAVPLDAPSQFESELPLPEGVALAKIPSPPPGFVREKPAERSAPPLPEIAPAETASAARPRSSGAIEVPAVTADLFGGGRPATARAAADDATYIATGEVIARVDGQPIHARDVDLLVVPVLNRLRQQAADADPEALAQRERDLRAEVLNRLIDRELTVREAAALGHKPNPNAVRAREAELAQMLAGSGIDLRREAERDVIMADMRARFGEKFAAVNPAAVREFYQQHKAEMRQPRQIALDQLVIFEDRMDRADRRPARDIAFEIAEQLEQGTPFDQLRRRYDEFYPAAALPHTPPALKPESAYSRQVLNAAGDLRSGAIFGPVPMPGLRLFGKVTDLRPAGPIPFAEAEKTIRTRLEAQSTENAFTAWIAGLRTRAKIEVARGAQ